MTSRKDFERQLAAKAAAAGHRIGMTRRDLLAHGVWSAAASVLAPSLPMLLAKTAFAACDDGAAPGALPPFLVFDMAGGAALAGNVLVGKAGGPEDLLPSYDVLGWDPREAGALDKRFGLPLSAKYSGLLAGLLAQMSPEAQAGLRLASACHFSLLDNATNKLNIASLVAALGNRGSQVGKGFGTVASLSGGNSDTAFPDPTLKPVFVKTVDDIIGASTFGGAAFQGLSKEQIKELALRSRDLSLQQRERIRSREGGQLLYDLTQCVYEKNITYALGASQLDPRQDGVAASVFGINQGTASDDLTAVQAGILTGAINQLTGPAVWTLGDCDYHTGSATKGDLQDRAMGDAIGRAVEYAHRAKKPLFFELITDGSCGANTGTRNWSSDTNEGLTLFGYYHPDAPPKYLRENVMQLGAFTAGQGADRAALIGSDPLKAAYAVFANYCNIAGKMDAFQQLVPNVFSPAELQSLLIFEGQSA